MNKSQTSNIVNAYNPWENSKTFIQDVGDLKSFIYFLDENNITTMNNNKEIFINENEEYMYYKDDTLSLLEKLEEISKLHFEKISLLEVLYEKYRNESILSKDKNYELCDSIAYLTEVLKKFENNKIKIANLLHNTQLSENNIIKIKHSKKIDFIKTMKIILNKVFNEDERSELELINLSLNMHVETINKLKTKYDEIVKISENMLNEYEDLKSKYL